MPQVNSYNDHTSYIEKNNSLMMWAGFGRELTREQAALVLGVTRIGIDRKTEALLPN